jgi:hypothetical protein
MKPVYPRHEREISKAGRKKLDVAQNADRSETLIGWKSGKTLLSPSMGPNGGSVAMDSEVDSSVVSPGWSKKIAPSFLIELFVQHL